MAWNIVPANVFTNEMHSFNILENSFTYPKNIVFLSLFSIVLILMNISFMEAKEISVRYLNGNRESMIYLRLYAKPIIISVLSFTATIFIASLFVLDFRFFITFSYIKILLHILMYNVLIMGILALAFYFMHKLSLRLGMLKRTFDSQILLYSSIILKILAILFLSLPIARLYEEKQASIAYLEHFKRYNEFNDYYLVNNINYGYEMDLEAQNITDLSLFEIVESLDLPYINSDELDFFFETDPSYLRYVSLNRSYIDKHEITDINGDVLITKI